MIPRSNQPATAPPGAVAMERTQMKELFITAEDLDRLRRNGSIVIYGDQMQKVRLKVC